MAGTNLYFAYGSNLNSSDWQRWCQRKGYAVEPLQPVRAGWLVDHRPIYHYHSHSRGGGALDVAPTMGHATPGMLFQISETGWKALDDKEGAPCYYERKRVTVLDESGDWQRAITYCVVPARRQEGFVRPSDAYARLVRDGLCAWSLPIDAHQGAAEDAVPVPLVRHLFVYGTLKSGHCRADALPGIKSREPARIDGRLLDLGSYPGWQPDADATMGVQGELLELTDPAAALGVADGIEGCAGYLDHALYHRVLVRARTATTDGPGVLAWSYRIADPGDAPLLPSGHWPDRPSSIA